MALVHVLGALGVKKEDGTELKTTDFFRPHQKEQTWEDMLAVMKANSQAMNMMAGKK